MTDPLVQCAEEHDYQRLFIQHLNWSRPDHPPLTVNQDGRSITATNVSSYKGLRVWVCSGSPDPKLEVLVDRAIATTTTDRLLIFHDDTDQIWRWPVRRHTERSITTRLTRHRHRAGELDAGFAAKLAAIQLPTDRTLDPNDVLSRVRAAFDVEAHNETKYASRLMIKLYTAMDRAYPAGHPPRFRDHQISVTLARILFLMFGDDTDMWEPDLFRDFVHAHTARDGSDIAECLTDLFNYVDTPDMQRAADASALAGFPYINGGIFSERISLPTLHADFRDAVLEACDRDWAAISPAIFGSMFQSVRDAQTRRELGEHYTSEENILKTLNPLFLDEARTDLQAALARDTVKKQINALNALWDKLAAIRYLDPACGCGNFIIVAYRELRAIELEVLEALTDLRYGAAAQVLDTDWTSTLRVSLDHFYGIEIDEWPARIAETAMFLVDRQCDLRLKERFGTAPDRLPIDRQPHITVDNALRVEWRAILEPTEHTIVAGNPPFLGKTERSASQTADMQAAWGTAYSGEADFVTAWFAKAGDFFGRTPGRWAFVATNSVTQGVAVLPVFGYLANQGWRIRFAHRTFEWTSDASGSAAVHCVIVGQDRLSSGPRRLFQYESVKSAPREIVVERINAYLVDGPELLVQDRRRALARVMETDIRFGSMPADGGGLLVSAAEYAAIRDTDPVAVKYLRRFVGAKELLNDKERWCIWMPDTLAPDARQSPFLKARIAAVLDFRSHKAKDTGVRAAAATPHRFNRVQQPPTDYLCIPRHVPESYEYFPAARYSPDVISGDANFVLDDPDGFFFAIVSSRIFMAWQKMVGGRIKNDPRFASTVTWNTFPLPLITTERRLQLAALGKTVLARRADNTHMSLAEQYEPTKMSGALRAAHNELDATMYVTFGLPTRHPSDLSLQESLFKHYALLIGAPDTGRTSRT